MKLTRCLDCKRIGLTTLCESCKSARTRKRGTEGHDAHTREHYDALYWRNRRAMMKDAEIGWLMGVYCRICGHRIARMDDISIEHIIPVAAGGTSDRYNLDYAHKKCNYGNAHNRRRRR